MRAHAARRSSSTTFAFGTVHFHSRPVWYKGIPGSTSDLADQASCDSRRLDRRAEGLGGSRIDVDGGGGYHSIPFRAGFRALGRLRGERLPAHERRKIWRVRVSL